MAITNEKDLSGILRHWPDPGVILSLLFLKKALVGFSEEYQAGNAIATPGDIE